MRTSCLEGLWLSLARGPEETSLWIWKVLCSCWSSWASPLSCGKIETSPCVRWQIFILSGVQQLGTSFCEVWQGHHWQKAVPWCPGKNFILQLEVSYWDQGKGFLHVEVYEWHPVVVWHGDFRQQVAVPCSPRNH